MIFTNPSLKAGAIEIQIRPIWQQKNFCPDHFPGNSSVVLVKFINDTSI